MDYSVKILRRVHSLGYSLCHKQTRDKVSYFVKHCWESIVVLTNTVAYRSGL